MWKRKWEKKWGDKLNFRNARKRLPGKEIHLQQGPGFEKIITVAEVLPPEEKRKGSERLRLKSSEDEVFFVWPTTLITVLG